MPSDIEFFDVGSYSFSPKHDLSNKKNYHRHVFIDHDGNISEAIRLNVLNDRHREEIVGYHFSLQYAKLHYQNSKVKTEFQVVGRDNPWDFEYVMHDGKRFFVEICRIADPALLKAIKSENDTLLLLQKPRLKGYEVLKIEKHFPGTYPELAAQVVSIKDKQKTFVVTPRDGKRIFIRPAMNPMIDLKEAMKSALDKKSAKKHDNKENTILILDNLTTHFDADDFFRAAESLKDFFDALPFQSVWLYTGYYSDDDGENYEFSLNALKPSNIEEQLFSELMGSSI